MLYKRSVLKNSKFTDKHKKQSSGGVLSKVKMSFKILQNSQKNIFAVVSLYWSYRQETWNFQEQPSLEMFCKTSCSWKVTPTYVFLCGFCELFKNTYFVEYLQTAASETPERRCLFNKVASLTAWSSFRGTPSNHIPYDVVFPFCRSVRFAA